MASWFTPYSKIGDEQLRTNHKGLHLTKVITATFGLPDFAV